MSISSRFLAAAAVTLVGVAPAVAQNVALNKPVTVTGPYTVSAPAGVGRVVDGTFATEGQFWQTNDIWWNGTATFINVNLGAMYVITGFTVQADNNDTYLLQYRSAPNADWQTAWAIPTKTTMPGVTTRTTTLGAPITATELRLGATAGDNAYGVTQIQATGMSAVPEPATVTMLGAGLLSLVVVARRRRA